MNLNKIKYNRINTINKIDDAVTNLIDVMDNSPYINTFDNLEDIIYKLNRLSEKVEKHLNSKKPAKKPAK